MMDNELKSVLNEVIDAIWSLNRATRNAHARLLRMIDELGEVHAELKSLSEPPPDAPEAPEVTS